jgi:hypothetical protein
MASVVTCICVILTALFLLPAFYFLPKVCPSRCNVPRPRRSSNVAYLQAVLSSIITLVRMMSVQWGQAFCLTTLVTGRLRYSGGGAP